MVKEELIFIGYSKNNFDEHVAIFNSRITGKQFVFNHSSLLQRKENLDRYGYDSSVTTLVLQSWPPR